MAPRLELFAFHYRDHAPANGSVRATSPTREEIAARYAEWKIVGQCEARNVDPEARYFTPHASPLDALIRSGEVECVEKIDPLDRAQSHAN